MLTGEHAAWFLKDGVFQSGVYLPTIDPAWAIAATADFNGDGYGDLVWQNTETGGRVIWFMRDAVFQSGTYLPNVDPAWQIVNH